MRDQLPFMQWNHSFRSATSALALALMLSACEPPTGPAGTSEGDFRAPVAADASTKQRQIAFLNRIREADPQGRTIDRALINEQNELGLILDRSVEMDKIPALMRTMLTQMAREFPKEDITVLAYTPSNPPRKIGTAHLDARTRDMTYTPAD
jgi:hypothetical protein